MARIRSVHPHTPTDPDFAAIPIPGRLLFIYSWTLADDAGNLEGNPVGLKMALFPADAGMTIGKITVLVEALVAGSFYIPYEAAGKRYLHIRNFHRYQRLDHPTAPKVPLAPGQKYSYQAREGSTYVWKTENAPPSSVPRTVHEQVANVPRTFSQEWKGLEGTGLDGTGLEGTGQEGKGPGRETKAPNEEIPEDTPEAAVKEDLRDNGAGKDEASILLYCLSPTIRSFAEKTMAEASAGLVSRPKAREQLRKRGVSSLAALVLIPGVQ